MAPPACSPERAFGPDLYPTRLPAWIARPDDSAERCVRCGSPQAALAYCVVVAPGAAGEGASLAGQTTQARMITTATAATIHQTRRSRIVLPSCYRSRALWAEDGQHARAAQRFCLPHGCTRHWRRGASARTGAGTGQFGRFGRSRCLSPAQARGCAGCLRFSDCPLSRHKPSSAPRRPAAQHCWPCCG